jgi:hypothetical protein
MSSTLLAALASLAAIALAGSLAFAYLTRVELPRPPIGVMGTDDLAFALVIIAAMTPALTLLPAPAIAAILALADGAILWTTAAPVLGGRRAGIFTCVMLGALFALVGAIGMGSGAAILANDVVLIATAAALANIWAQAGIRLSAFALFVAGLGVYDFVATTLLGLTGEMFVNLSQIPLQPLVGFGASSHGQPAGLGYGDLVILTAWPLIAWKAYGRFGAGTALLAELALMAAMVALAALTESVIPVITPLAPLVLAQLLWLRRTQGEERTLAGLRATQADRHPVSQRRGPSLLGSVSPDRA